MEFTEKLKALRKQRKLRQFELAEKAGLSANKVQRYEQANQKPKGDDALRLAKALGVSADYLLDDSLPYPPPEECLSEKVVIIRKLEVLIGALTSRDTDEPPATAGRPDVVHLPVLRLGAGFDVTFDATGLPQGDATRDMFFNGLGEGTFFAAELHGSSMRDPGGAGFSMGDVLVFKVVEPDDITSGDYVYVRTDDQGLFRQAFVHGDRIRLRALNPADPEVVIERPDLPTVSRLVRRVREY